MKNIVYIFPFVFLLFFGCEKVIDVDLNEANPEVVIEGNLSSSPMLAEVKLSKTGSYFGESVNEKISGATVFIENDMGTGYILEEIEDGVYKSFEIFPEEGIEYHLTVESDEQIYKSNSVLNPTVVIDTLSYFYDEGFAFLDEGYIVKVFFTDPGGVENNYRIKIYENDALKNESDNVILFNDRLMDGNQIEVTLRGYTFDVGDTVAIQLISLDEGAYKYFDTFRELINVNPGSAAPANPISNISNGALGYFSAWSSDMQTVIIED